MQIDRFGGLPFPVSAAKITSHIRAFVDYFILFSGISTARNLARTQRRPLFTRGVFLFRPR